MRLSSVTANRHIFEGEVNGEPLRLLLTFEGDRTLCLQVAEDGERMIVDDGSLDPPQDMSRNGRIDTSDVTASLFPSLKDMKVVSVEALTLGGKRVGVKLTPAIGQTFHFWVDGDELHWGDEAALVSHDWLDGVPPTPSACLQV